MTARVVLLMSGAMLLSGLAALATAGTAAAAPACIAGGGALHGELCVLDADGDGRPDGASGDGGLRAAAAVFTVEVGASARVEDTGGDQVPDSATLVPASVAVSWFTYEPGCVPFPEPTACFFRVCVVCTSVSARVWDGDGNGAPDRAAVTTALGHVEVGA